MYTSSYSSNLVAYRKNYGGAVHVTVVNTTHAYY
jgi:hypothetical protein